ncbi:hypothetical protein C6503_01240 [Candidatus Poribacteria bacterium]|nr:MAG: hypothetical protein C6503_01240 [Candidatus Poribacteria bacterium]
MKKSLRGKIREYIQSEEGKVGVKSPLSLGVAAGGLLLGHAIVGTPRAEALWCTEDHPVCPPKHVCMDPFIWNGMDHVGTCVPI